MLEREVPLLCDAFTPGHAAREVRIAVRRDVGANAFELLVAHGRIPDPHLLEIGHGRLAKVHLLEQLVHRVADLRRTKPAVAAAMLVPAFLQARDVERVVLVGALLEGRERCEREPSHMVQRRLGRRDECRQHRRRYRRRDLLPRGEQRELAFVGRGLLRPLGLGPVRLAEAVDAHHEASAVPFELDRRVTSGFELFVRSEAAEHPADRRRCIGLLLAVDRARDDQALLRARHGHVVEAQLFGFLFRASRLANVVVVEGAATLRRDGIGDPEAEAAVGERENLVG